MTEYKTSERHKVNALNEREAVSILDFSYSCDSENSVYSYGTKDGIGLSIPVHHAIGDHQEVEIPIERKT